ncbi:sensor histidine kinase [Labrys monachus]|uniref:histidine kinase n=1 Tax=Labrys monachus TaxID=217067 RepID=A0ABU0FLS1_9HYPH|nr:ATP-binding protein [Labrys monachus]MDQ0395560.1 C4-dicarboxylate-specific signal transduction histidine kinase [Labrys monachus]
MLSKQRNRPGLRAVFIASLLICIFVADTVTDFEIAFAVFYIAVILSAIGFLSTRGVVFLASVCVGLTAISLLLTKQGSFEAGVFNCGISASAIGVTTYLALKTVAAQAAAHDAQEQLARVARLTRLGALTASIAHEVNQPLAAVVTSADACRRWLAHEPPNLAKARQAAERIVRDASRAGEVIARVRGLARNEPSRREPLDLNEAAIEAVAMAQHEIERNGVALQWHLAEDLPAAMADRVQIQQVIGNLLLNALEAMAGLPSFRRELEISSSRDADGNIVLAVADSGAGMKPSVLEHAFDAFWTTKETGMGIGLAISRSIIEAHGGRIWATSEPRMGAVFRFSLPAAGKDTP